MIQVSPEELREVIALFEFVISDTSDPSHEERVLGEKAFREWPLGYGALERVLWKTLSAQRVDRLGAIAPPDVIGTLLTVKRPRRTVLRSRIRSLKVSSPRSLITVFSNLVKDQTRSQRYRLSRTTTVEPIDRDVEFASADETVIRFEACAAMSLATQQLYETDLKILYLVHVEGSTIAAAAKRVGMTKSQLKADLKTAEDLLLLSYLYEKKRQSLSANEMDLATSLFFRLRHKGLCVC